MPSWIDALRRLWRSRREHAEPDETFWEAVESTLPFLRNIPPTAWERVRRLAARFLATKTFYGAHGLPITDLIAGNIAWQAALVAHRTGLGIYDDFVGVIVYPEPFRVRRRFADEIGLVHEFDDELYGETWEGGPVIVSWGTGEAEGMQVVLHEFAHRLDLADGALDGVPLLPPSLPRARWEHVMATALQRLQDELDAGKSPPLDPYAEEGPEEFFPVATETFFTEPEALAVWDPALFAALCEVYGLHPSPADSVVAHGPNATRSPMALALAWTFPVKPPNLDSEDVTQQLHTHKERSRNMKKTWVLVANASVAKFYEFLGFKSGVQLVETREHPESRLPNRELITDNLPFPGTGSDKAPHTGEPPVPPKKHEAELFAIEVARRLREARVEQALEQLVLMGPANFLAMVKEHLDEPTRKILVRDVEKDYTKADDKTIAEKAAEALLPPA